MTAQRCLTIWFVLWFTAWLLIGCAKTQYIDRPVEVKVPIFQPCEVEPPPPLAPLSVYLRKDAADFEKIKALLLERRELQRQEEILRQMLAICTAEQA